MTNEGIFTPHLLPSVLRSNCPSLPVKLDEALIMCKQSVAAETHCAGVIYADSLDRVDAGSVIKSGQQHSLSMPCTVVAHGIYWICLQERFQSEVFNLEWFPGSIFTFPKGRGKPGLQLEQHRHQPLSHSFHFQFVSSLRRSKD